MLRNLAVIAIAMMMALALPGCVAKKKYTALETDFNVQTTSMRMDIDTLNKELEAIKAEKAATEATLMAANAKIADLDRQVEQIGQQRSKLETQLAEVVKDRSRMKASVAEMELALAAQAARQREAEQRMAEYRDLTARFKAMIDAGTLRVRIVDGRMVVQLSSDILFDSGSAKLSTEGKESILQVSQVLASIPDRKYQIEGHTDNVPIKTQTYPSNWELGFGRAMSVVNTMAEGGLAAVRLSAASFGDNRPVATNDTAEGKAQNRRIEIVLVPDLSSLPGFGELQKLAAE